MRFLTLLTSDQNLSEKVSDTLTKTPVTVIDETIKTLGDTPIESIITTGLDYLVKFGLKILAAFAIYIIGAWIVKKTKRLIKNIFIKRNLDPSLASFILSFYSITFTILLIIVTIGVLGVDTSSIVAVLAGSGLAVGMALSGTLQNFAGGMMILLFKPFKIGDFIEAQGYSGTVQSIEITTTHITTPDNKKIILPNGALSNGSINNYSITGTRRCEWKIGISYGDDVAVAKQVILNIIKEHPALINEPMEPFAALADLADSSVIVVARAWTKSEDYWTFIFDVNEKVYNELPKHGINFPFPQLDVHLKQS